MGLQNKVVVVTGASSGIGRACAEEFAKQGAHVVLAGRRIVTICEITAELEKKYGVRCLAVECDVSKQDDCKYLIDHTVMSFGKLDVLVNNAGVSMRALFKNVDLEVVHHIMNVNFFGTVYCTKYALPEIIKTGGSVVGVSSINGYQGTPGRTAYAASKYAMNGFLESLRIELLQEGVHVMNVAPYFTASDIRKHALREHGEQQGESHLDEHKLFTAESVAKALVKGVINRKRDVVLSLRGKLAILLNKLFPGSLDKKIYDIFSKEKNPLF